MCESETVIARGEALRGRRRGGDLSVPAGADALRARSLGAGVRPLAPTVGEALRRPAALGSAQARMRGASTASAEGKALRGRRRGGDLSVPAGADALRAPSFGAGVRPQAHDWLRA